MRTRWIVAAGLAAVGLIWIGQGFGLIRGSSFMVDDLRWAIAGGVLLLVSAALGWAEINGGRRA